MLHTRKRFSEPHQKPFGPDFQVLVEGNSVRSTGRLCGVEKRIVLNILKLAGEASERLLTEKMRSVPVEDLEVDEIWSYVGCKQKNLRPHHPGWQFRDACTFIPLERTSKLVVTWRLGKRDRLNIEAPTEAPPR